MGIITKGVRLFSMLKRSDDEKKDIIRCYADTHSWENVEKLHKGDIVRSGTSIGIVFCSKALENYGLVAWVDTSKCKWYYVLTYSPYLHELAFDGSCELVTKASSCDDGLANQKVIKQLKISLEDKERSLAMSPADQHYFPAFNSCKYSKQEAYLSSLNELRKITDNKSLFDQYVSLEELFHNIDMKDKDGKCQLWSSTDAQNLYSEESDVFMPEFYSLFHHKEGITHLIQVFSEYWQLGSGFLWTIRTSSGIVGFVGVMDIPNNATLFYATHPAHRNKGYMKESVMCCLEYFSKQYTETSIHSVIFDDNIPSLRILSNTAVKIDLRQRNNP